MSATQLRPRSAPEILDVAFQLLREHTRALFVLATVVVIPGTAIGIVNQLLIGDAAQATRVNPAAPFASVGRILAVTLPATIISTTWFLVGFGALLVATSSAYLDGVDREPGDALRQARSRAGTLIGAGLLTALLVFVQLMGLMVVVSMAGGIIAVFVSLIGRSASSATAAGVVGFAFALVIGIALLLAGIALAARYVALPAVIMHEAVGIGDAMRRARTLAKGSLRRIVALLVLMTVLSLILVFGLFATLTVVLGNRVIASAIASLINVPLYALTGAIVTVLYYDLRIRSEGLDISMLADELDALPTAAPLGEATS